MSAWTRNGEGTYIRRITRSRRDRRCDDCRRPLPKGEPYVEHRASAWSEFSEGRFYSIHTCGVTTSECTPPTPPTPEATDAAE